MIDLTSVASAGLVVMAVWGSTLDLQGEHGMGDRSNGNWRVTTNIRGELNAAAEAAGLLINCLNSRREYIAETIEFPDGTQVAMVEPIWQGFCYDDHFIIRYGSDYGTKAGTIERWDVGFTERIPPYSGSPNRDYLMSVSAIPRQITDFAKLRMGDDGGGGVGSLIPPTPTPTPDNNMADNNDNAGNDMADNNDNAGNDNSENDNSGSDTSESGGGSDTSESGGGSDTSENGGGSGSGSTESVGASSSGGGSSGAGALLGGVIVVGAMLYLGTGGGLGDLSWSPSYTFTQTDFGSSYYYGARMDYAKENVRAYWYGGQSGTGRGQGDWSYGSGGSLTKGNWRASYSGTGNRESMTGDMWLSMFERVGIWRLETGLGGLIGIDESATTTSYFVRGQTEMKLNDWTLTQSANWNGTSWNLDLDFVHSW